MRLFRARSLPASYIRSLDRKTMVEIAPHRFVQHAIAVRLDLIPSSITADDLAAHRLDRLRERVSD